MYIGLFSLCVFVVSVTNLARQFLRGGHSLIDSRIPPYCLGCVVGAFGAILRKLWGFHVPKAKNDKKVFNRTFVTSPTRIVFQRAVPQRSRTDLVYHVNRQTCCTVRERHLPCPTCSGARLHRGRSRTLSGDEPPQA